SKNLSGQSRRRLCWNEVDDKDPVLVRCDPDADTSREKTDNGLGLPLLQVPGADRAILGGSENGTAVLGHMEYLDGSRVPFQGLAVGCKEISQITHVKQAFAFGEFSIILLQVLQGQPALSQRIQ